LLACLELARDGRIEIRQLKAFDEVYVKDRATPPEAEAAA
jgi:chromatin segregation and condensation protein Rec8/ScpA/Scc1 (kleisin family)